MNSDQFSSLNEEAEQYWHFYCFNRCQIEKDTNTHSQVNRVVNTIPHAVSKGQKMKFGSFLIEHSFVYFSVLKTQYKQKGFWVWFLKRKDEKEKKMKKERWKRKERWFLN